MPSVPAGCKLVLDPDDDYNHAPDATSNYNESMYFSVFDLAQGLGGWYRLGNRVNEGHAETSNCWYLPDGRVAFMASRPAIETNEHMDAGGLRFEVVVPMQRHRVTYEGSICVLENPKEMADPRRAFRENPIVPCQMEIVHGAVTPVCGGEIVREDGTPLPQDPEKGFAKAHFDQFMSGEGWLRVGDERFEVQGHGARDKSWGPRYWQSIDWYRWLHLYVNPELSIQATVLCQDGRVRCTGNLFTPDGHIEFEGGSLVSDWDDETYQTHMHFTTEVDGRAFDIQGEVFSLIPLRNRRQREDGSWLVTRITEAMTSFRCNGESALGMTEYLDQIVDGRPIGMDAGA